MEHNVNVLIFYCHSHIPAVDSLFRAVENNMLSSFAIQHADLELQSGLYLQLPGGITPS